MKCDICSAPFKTMQGVRVHKARVHDRISAGNGNGNGMHHSLPVPAVKSTDPLDQLLLSMNPAQKVQALHYVLDPEGLLD